MYINKFLREKRLVNLFFLFSMGSYSCEKTADSSTSSDNSNDETKTDIAEKWKDAGQGNIENNNIKNDEDQRLKQQEFEKKNTKKLFLLELNSELDQRIVNQFDNVTSRIEFSSDILSIDTVESDTVNNIDATYSDLQKRVDMDVDILDENEKQNLLWSFEEKIKEFKKNIHNIVSDARNKNRNASCEMIAMDALAKKRYIEVEEQIQKLEFMRGSDEFIFRIYEKIYCIIDEFDKQISPKLDNYYLNYEHYISKLQSTYFDESMLIITQDLFSLIKALDINRYVHRFKPLNSHIINIIGPIGGYVEKYLVPGVEANKLNNIKRIFYTKYSLQYNRKLIEIIKDFVYDPKVGNNYERFVDKGKVLRTAEEFQKEIIEPFLISLSGRFEENWENSKFESMRDDLSDLLEFMKKGDQCAKEQYEYLAGSFSNKLRSIEKDLSNNLYTEDVEEMVRNKIANVKKYLGAFFDEKGLQI